MRADRSTPTRARTRLTGAVLMIVAALAVICCATLAQPTAADAAWAADRWPGTTQADLVRGRALYVKRCAGCHALPRPERYPTSTWEPHLDEMAERAALQRGERELLLHFLMTMGRPPITAPSPTVPSDAG